MCLTQKEISKIEGKIVKSLDCLFSLDEHLIKEDLNERCITHKLAIYLQKFFKKYDVDCEYNGNVDSDSKRKEIYEKLEVPTEPKNLDEELMSRYVYPDIIIHKRGTNGSNLCIIEVKKSTNKSGATHDKLKLELYTSENENGLKYGVGFFLKLQTGKDFSKSTKKYAIEKYVEGQIVP